MEGRALAFKSPYKISAIHRRHLALGATIVEIKGWLRPERYTSPGEEKEAIHRGVGLCDISPVTKLLIQGKVIQVSMEKTFSSLPEVGQAEGHALTISNGPTPAEVMICRLCKDEAFILAPEDEGQSIAQTLEKEMKECVHLVDMTSALAGIALRGPRSLETLAKLTELDVSPTAFPNLSCAQGSVAEVHAIVVRCDSQETGYEIYFGRDFGEYVWDAIMEAGEEFQIRPFGLTALQAVRSVR